MIRVAMCLVSVPLLVACGGGSGGSGGSGGTGATNGSTSANGVTNGSGTGATSTGQTSSGNSSSTGMTGAFACEGMPLPTTAPAMVKLAGVTQTEGLGGPQIVANATVAVFQGASVTPVATTTSDAQGKYSVTLSTGGTPLDGYAHVTAPSYLDTYLYPPKPIAADITNATGLLLNTNTFMLVQSFESVTETPGDGFIGIVVSDCDGNPVAGATVTTMPAGTVRYNQGGFPNNQATSTDADGVAYVFNVPAGDVTVQATAGSHTLREHVVNARADVITTTVLQP